MAAASVSIPHALGLGLVAFAPLADPAHASAWALWSAALPGAWMTLMARRSGIVYAPSTAVALLFGGMLAQIMEAGAVHHITAQQALAMAGAFVALGFVLQWLIGQARLAGLARFLPVSVTQGFSAGVGLSLVLSQFHTAFGAGTWDWGPRLVWHLGVAVAVAVLNVLLQRRSPRLPTLLMAVAVGAVLAWWWAPAGVLRMADQARAMSWLPLPDWAGAPWLPVLREAGGSLFSLALLMAVVNGLEVLVFHQQLESDYSETSDPNDILKHESLCCAACAVFGLIPASASSSRSRTALLYTHQPERRVGQWHAALMLAVALTGHLWLQWVPLAALGGALVVAGARMLPAAMLRLPEWRAQRVGLWQSWLVAALFSLFGGVMALLTGLAISTLALLRTSAAHAIRRAHLSGKLRSRHVRRAEADAWLATHMSQVAVFELQGIVSFGVAALVIEEVRASVRDHRIVVIDASRVPSWDVTGYTRLSALARQLEARGIALVIAGVRGLHRQALRHLQCFDDLDRALEWAEDRVLQTMPTSPAALPQSAGLLEELGVDIEPTSRTALEQRMLTQHHEAGDVIIRHGEIDRRLMIVQQGTVLLSTAQTPDAGLRLSVIGSGMVFGEMAFLNGIARTAYGLAGHDGARVAVLDWNDFDTWSRAHPDGALAFMKALARLGIRRLGMTSQELRAAME